MITRRASEIIRLALSMSQIQNSDALSWRDKIDMLNQSYVRLYDDLNNNGDLYYSKEIEFNAIEQVNYQENKVKLPPDFWKLLLIGYKSSRGEIVPIERAPNTGQYFSGYRIINNELIFNSFFTPGPLVVRYIPQPQTITFPRPAHRIAGKEMQAAYDSLNDVIVLGSVGSIRVIDYSSGRTISTDTLDGKFVLAVSSGVIYAVSMTEIQCFNYELDLLYSYEGTFDLYAHAIGWEDGIIISIGGVPHKFIIEKEPIESEDYWNFLDGHIVKTGDDYIFYNSDNTVLYITELFTGNDSYVIADPYIYINKAGSVKVYEEFRVTDIAPALIGRGTRKGLVLAAEANNESGYGVIFRDFHNDLNLLGYAADTVMNYPQNVFFDWLISDLAIKFRIALDIPTGELPALADDYHDTLLKGISRDVYQMARINNVYGRAFL